MKPLILLTILLLITSCTTESLPEEKTIIGPNDIKIQESRNLQKGVAGITPKNNYRPSDEDWNDYFSMLGEYGPLWGVYVNIEDSLQEGIPQQVRLAYELAKMRPVTPVVALGFQNDIEKGFFELNGLRYQETVLAVAKEYHPAYLGLGIDVNRIPDEEFDNYLNWYKDTYNEVKKVSPSTKIFPIIQYEHLLNSQEDDWLEELEMDVFAITLYPFLAFDSPADIPRDYLPNDVPILITETGWPSSEVGRVQPAQTEYIDWLSTTPTNVEAVLWSFSHDPMLGDKTWDSISLKFSNGTMKPAFNKWQSLN